MIGRFLEKTLPVALTPYETTQVDMLLSRSYLLSYLTELGANMLVDFPWAGLSCGISQEHGSRHGFSLLSVRRFDLVLGWLGMHTYVYHLAELPELVQLRSIPEFGALTSAIYDRAESTSLRAAVMKVRQDATLSPARTLAQAQRNVISTAERL